MLNIPSLIMGNVLCFGFCCVLFCFLRWRSCASINKSRHKFILNVAGHREHRKSQGAGVKQEVSLSLVSSLLNTLGVGFRDGCGQHLRDEQAQGSPAAGAGGPRWHPLNLAIIASVSGSP